ncbi:hypothetical protein [Methylobacillus flagellatus]|uniref:hypothetical protein n=1 Tax=Methylobacillus flagellatus TaxID=405 RepID=UPI0018A12898|nr:hypothetical protein [Methylobacillus flagellatus]
MAQDPKNTNRKPSVPAQDSRRSINESNTRVNNNSGTGMEKKGNVVSNTASPPDRGNKPKK